MKSFKPLVAFILFLLLQVCLFGFGNEEKELTHDYKLMATNYMEEMSIWHDSHQIIDETVFAVGYDDNFIIAKSHPKAAILQINKNITHFYIIEINKTDSVGSAMTQKEFELKRKQLQISSDLDFTIVYEELQ